MRLAAILVALIALASGQTPPPPAPALRIVSPPDGAYVSGPITLLAAAEPLSIVARIARVSFWADGRQVCTVERPPYECAWDAGDVVVEHLIRAVATLTDGSRLVASARTKKLDHGEIVDVDAVQVTAVITDSRGRFVGGLSRAAFAVYEDDRRQAIGAFTSEDVPLELVAAVDISGSMRLAMEEMKGAVREFLAAVPERHEVTLIGFNDNIIPLTRRSRDPAARLKAVDRLAAWGRTALYDVIIMGLDMLDRRTGRKALVVFTDGEDQGSHATRDDALRRLEESDATLYMIGQGRAGEAADLQQLMERLAKQSGGRAFFPDEIEELRGIFREIIEDLSNQYLLSYVTTNSARDGTWRAITIEVEGGYRIRAREGYRAKTARR